MALNAIISASLTGFCTTHGCEDLLDLAVPWLLWRYGSCLRRAAQILTWVARLLADVHETLVLLADALSRLLGANLPNLETNYVFLAMRAVICCLVGAVYTGLFLLFKPNVPPVQEGVWTDLGWAPVLMYTANLPFFLPLPGPQIPTLLLLEHVESSLQLATLATIIVAIDVYIQLDMVKANDNAKRDSYIQQSLELPAGVFVLEAPCLSISAAVVLFSLLPNESYFLRSPRTARNWRLHQSRPQLAQTLVGNRSV